MFRQTPATKSDFFREKVALACSQPRNPTDEQVEIMAREHQKAELENSVTGFLLTLDKWGQAVDQYIEKRTH